MPDRKTFDAKDLKILQALQQDASQRLEDIARLVHLAPSSVHERVRRLQREGLLQRWTVAIDAGAMGLGVVAFIGLRTSKSCGDLIPALHDLSAVEECYSVAGEVSMLLKVRTCDMDSLFAVCEQLRQIAGIEGTTTTMVLKAQFQKLPLLPALQA